MNFFNSRQFFNFMKSKRSFNVFRKNNSNRLRAICFNTLEKTNQLALKNFSKSISGFSLLSSSIFFNSLISKAKLDSIMLEESESEIIDFLTCGGSLIDKSGVIVIQKAIERCRERINIKGGEFFPNSMERAYSQ